MLRRCDSQARRHPVVTIQEIESNHDGDRRNADNNDFPQMSRVRERSQISVSLGGGIALVHPVRAEVVGDVEHLDVGETHRAQGIVGRLDVRAMTPRATAAINNDELVSRQRLGTLAQRLQAAFAGGRPDVFSSRNMRLGVQHVRSHLDNKRLFPRGRLEDFDQFVGLRSCDLGMALA